MQMWAAAANILIGYFIEGDLNSEPARLLAVNGQWEYSGERDVGGG